MWKRHILIFLKNPSYFFSFLGHEQTKVFIIFGKYLPIFIDIFKKGRRIWYKGTQKLCPCCGRNYRKFLPVGTKIRTSAQCPGCFSLERHRLLLLYLKFKTSLFLEKLKVLDIAPLKILQNLFKNQDNLEYISIDLSSPIAMLRMNVENLKFADNSFDVIFCLHVLEHVNNDVKALKEFYRILKPKGWAIIQSPIDYSLKKTLEDYQHISRKDRRILFGEENHLRIYGIDYINRLKNAGFNVNVVDFVKNFNPKLVNKLGLDNNELIYHCIK